MWDYLIVTAGNEAQAAAYRALLEERRALGLIPDVRKVLVVPDAKGKRIGSGGSTILCLLEVLNDIIPPHPPLEKGGIKSSVIARTADRTWQSHFGVDAGHVPKGHVEENARDMSLMYMSPSVFSSLRILIVHAGGDSRRLPAYGPCGKLFVPIPGDSDQAVPLTIFDRLVPTYLALPPNAPGQGQVVVCSGDVLLFFDPEKVRFDRDGITGLGAYAAPETSKNHGVFCAGPGGRVRTYLQKPALDEQAARGAIDRAGQSVLDIGVFSLDGHAAERILALCGPARTKAGRWAWKGEMVRAIEEFGLDFYREITTALGTETGVEDYIRSVRRAGSRFPERHLQKIHRALSGTPLYVSILPRCDFLHFGTSHQLIESGNAFQGELHGAARHRACLDIDNVIEGEGRLAGTDSWVEGCRIRAALTAGGDNVVVGADVDEPLSLPPKTVLDVIEGKDRRGKPALFVRCYGVDDGLKQTEAEGATLLNMPVGKWLGLMGARPEDVWDARIKAADRTIWNGRFFPAVRSIIPPHPPLEKGGIKDSVIAGEIKRGQVLLGQVLSGTSPEAKTLGGHVPNSREFGYMSPFLKQWLWMLEPEKASAAQKKAWKAADRYSFDDMARLASHEDFHKRRRENRAEDIRANSARLFSPRSGFSAAELQYVLSGLDFNARAALAADTIKSSFVSYGKNSLAPGIENLALSRILHTLGTVIGSASGASAAKGLASRGLLWAVENRLSRAERAWLESLNIPAPSSVSPRAWARAAGDAAFENVGRTIVFSTAPAADYPKCALRSDEIVWGRAPARFDLGGGWSDTPPYSLEHGGSVINAAANLNGQPPIQVYARVVPEPKIGIFSIDHGAGLTVRTLEELLDYRQPASRFGLAKAAVALSGFSSATAAWPKGTKTLAGMLKKFGGGIELTTLAAIPSGSGLGTSSIMGAVLMAVVSRLMGRTLTERELFHRVLQLEQELTTGGGWQDQIGGVLPGVKVITTEAGLIPDPRIHYVPADVLDPALNKGQTLLYYTGLRRLAKNILRTVVGRYLDRDREAMRTLRDLHAFPPALSAAMAAKDMRKFGGLIDTAWGLKKAIDPDSTTEVIEGILDRIKPHMFGATLLGAGGGGFLLIIARSPEDAEKIRTELESRPPNSRARFFAYDISREGLSVTVC